MTIGLHRIINALNLWHYPMNLNRINTDSVAVIDRGMRLLQYLLCWTLGHGWLYYFDYIFKIFNTLCPDHRVYASLVCLSRAQIDLLFKYQCISLFTSLFRCPILAFWHFLNQGIF